MSGKTIIVTGASAGIGYEVARVLCEGGNDVILACRSEEKTNRCIERIKKQNPSALATFMQLDLGSLASIRTFVDNFHATEKKLTVLVNNAGLAVITKDAKRQFTSDNFELTMGTNHLGPFLLTHLLLADLKKAAAEGVDARIVVVSSMMHDTEFAKRRGPVVPLDVDNFFLATEGSYNGLQAYKNSKLANILFTFELNRQLQGSGVKVNALCPGFVPTTELMRSANGVTKFFTRYVLGGLLRFTKTTRTIQQAAACVCALAIDEKLKDETGKFFRDGIETKTSDESLDEEKQKRIWELSGGYTHLEGFEPLEAPPPPVEPEVVKEEPAAPNGDVAPAEEPTGETGVTTESKTDDADQEKGDADKKEDGHKAVEEKETAVEDEVKESGEEAKDEENMKKSEIADVIENKEVSVE